MREKINESKKEPLKIQGFTRNGKLSEDLFYQKDKYLKKSFMMNAANANLITCKTM